MMEPADLKDGNDIPLRRLYWFTDSGRLKNGILIVELSRLACSQGPETAGRMSGRGASSRGARAVLRPSGPPQESAVAGLMESVN
jgi:hypothetical protein